MLSKPVRFLRFLALCTAATAISAGPALAVAAECTGYERRLASLQRGGNPEAAKWADAAKRQSGALKRAQRDAKRFGCGTQAAGPSCAGLTAKIGKMKSNLAKIERQKARAGRKSGSNTAEIRKLRRALNSSKCKAPKRQTAAVAKPKVEGPANDFLAKLFNHRSKGEMREMRSGLIMTIPGNGLIQVRTEPGRVEGTRSRAVITTGKNRRRIPAGGTFRTMCVRTCDGFAFPISFATGKDQFVNDAARCTEMCPAADTELFVYKNPGQNQADMVSLSGIVYGEMENAYRHQREYVKGCSCRAGRNAQAGSNMTPLTDSADSMIGSAGQTEANGGQLDDRLPGVRYSSYPLSADQLPEDADPDTRLNLMDGFDASVVIPDRKPSAEETNVADLGSDGRPTLEVLPGRPNRNRPAADIPSPNSQRPKTPSRIVGPKFLAGQ